MQVILNREEIEKAIGDYAKTAVAPGFEVDGVTVTGNKQGASVQLTFRPPTEIDTVELATKGDDG